MMQHDPEAEFRAYHMRSYIRPSLPYLILTVTSVTFVLQIVDALVWPPIQTIDIVAMIVSAFMTIGSGFYLRHRTDMGPETTRRLGIVLLFFYSGVITTMGHTDRESALYVVGAASLVCVAVAAFSTRLQTMILIQIAMLLCPTISLSVQTGRSVDQVAVVAFIVAACITTFVVNRSFQKALLLTYLDARENWMLAQYDGLTGLHNRPAWIDMSTEACEHASSYSLLFIDADRFKSINDRYGHGAGDRVLKQLGTLFQDLSPASAVIGRVGGEEFAMALPNMREAAATRLANLLRERVESMDHLAAPVTISIGVATSHAGETFESVLERADLSMLRSKHGGRNRVTVSESDPERVVVDSSITEHALIANTTSRAL